MATDTPDSQKNGPDLEVSLDIDENPHDENGLLKSGSLLIQKRQQCSLVSSSGKWLQIVKNSPHGSFSRATSFFDNKIPRHLVSLDEKYLRRCLDLISISAFKSASCSLSMNLVGTKMDFSPYRFDSFVIPKENVTRLVFDLPLVDDSGSPVISPVILGCKRVTHKLDKPLESQPLVSYIVDSRFRSYESGNIPKKVVSLSSPSSSSSSEKSSSEKSSSCWSSPSVVSQGAIQFTMKDHKTPHFVFSLDDQKEIYVASLDSGFNRSSLEYSYLIHLKHSRGSEPEHLVGKVKVSTLISVSPTNRKTVERQFVLYTNGGNPQLPRHIEIKKNRGLPKKVVDAFKGTTTRGTRQRSISRFSRTSSIPDFCSWEPFQEPNHELEPISLLDNELPPNLETLAIVVKEQCPKEEEEEVGGWGMKFLKKPPLARTDSENSTSIDVVIPAGIHGRPRQRNGGASSLIQRWKSGGSCDCFGWDLGCPLTVFKGQARKDQNSDHCNVFELFAEGMKHSGLRIMSVRDDLCFVQFEAEISVLQSFSIALAYVHSQSQRLRTWS